jgi:hypothetical protein
VQAALFPFIVLLRDFLTEVLGTFSGIGKFGYQVLGGIRNALGVWEVLIVTTEEAVVY